MLQHNGFDENSRKEHNRTVGRLAALLEQHQQLVIVALISPYRDVRDEVRKLCDRFIEVYVSTDLETCRKRDSKGLYKKAIAGEISNFTGISAPYEKPLQPEIELSTSLLTQEECTNLLLNYLNNSKT